MAFCDVLLRGQIPPSAAYPRELLTIGDHIRTRRLDLGLRQKDVARLLGVSTDTIGRWEVAGYDPDVRYLPAIIDFLGYNPEPEHASFGERVAWHRRRHGLARKRLAPILGVDPASITKVEADRPVGRALIEIFKAPAGSGTSDADRLGGRRDTNSSIPGTRIRAGSCSSQQ